MRSVLSSGFLTRFAGGFALGAVAVFGMQPDVIATKLAAIAPALTHLA